MREEASQDEISQDGDKHLGTELRESESTVNQLTNQMKELQEVVNSLSESEAFKDLETSSSSGSVHAPGKPFVFRVFQVCIAATVASTLYTEFV